MVGNLPSGNPLHGGDPRGAKVEQRRDLDTAVAPVGSSRQREVPLFAVEVDFVVKFVLNLFKRFPVVKRRNPEIITSFIQVRAHALEQLQFLFETFLDLWLEDLEHTMPKPRFPWGTVIPERDNDGDTRFRQCGRFERQAEPVQRTEFSCEDAPNGFEGDGGRERLELLKVLSQLDREPAVSCQNLSQLVQCGATPR
jgi:hypothetical protein